MKATEERDVQGGYLLVGKKGVCRRGQSGNFLLLRRESKQAKKTDCRV